MNLYTIPAIGLSLAIGGSIFSGNAALKAIEDQYEFDNAVSDHKITLNHDSFDLNEKCDYWSKYGYSSMIEYKEALAKERQKVVGKADQAVSLYSFTDEQKEKLYLYEEKMLKAESFKIFDKYSDLFDEIVSGHTQTYSSTPSYEVYSGSSGGLTMSQGVNYFEGRRETWYSSNILYHYMTPQWTPDSNGVYRDSDGYVVVAASDLAYGSLVNTSHGMGKVYDSGCAPGTTDIYVNW